MRVINRTAVTLAGKQPYLDWMNNRDTVFPRLPDEGGDDEEEEEEKEEPETTESPALIVEPSRSYGTAVLLPEFSDETDVLDWVEENYAWLFESQLSAWTEDEAAWPQSRDLAMFKAWFRVNIHTAVVDAGDDDIDGEEL